MNILDRIVTESVNQFVVEKEYNEFISLLKLYINSQTSNCNLVHLIYLKNESILLDENKEIINISKDIFNAKYLSDISFSSNDFTLNSLLTLLPNKIYIHIINCCVDEFITTLQSIFENRINICKECSICNLYKISKENINLKKVIKKNEYLVDQRYFRNFPVQNLLGLNISQDILEGIVEEEMNESERMAASEEENVWKIIKLYSINVCRN